MKDKKISILALAVAGSTLLTGCGGSGSESGSIPPSNGPQTITAIDGYLQNAEVYIDANANGRLEVSEQGLGPIGSTNASGKISVAGINFNGNLVVRAVAGKTIDSDSGVVDKTYVLGAPKGSAFITPFTHIAQTTGVTVGQLAEDLGLDESVIAGDYIAQKASSDVDAAAKASIAHALARFVVSETKKGSTESLVSSNLVAAKATVEAEVEAGADPDLVELELQEDGSISDDVPPTALEFEKTTLQDTNWSMFRFDDVGDNEHYFIRFGSANNPDAFCLDNETFGFQGKTVGIEAPTSACSSDTTFDVNSDGNLVWNFTDDSGNPATRELTMLHRFSEGGYSMFLMVADNGELFWVDNNPELKDAGDYRVEEDVITYSFRDDNPDFGSIDYFLMQSEFTVTGDQAYTVSGAEEELNTGDLVLSALNHTDSATTTFKTVPLYEMNGQMQTSDDIVITVENLSVDSEEHWYFPYRTAGDLTLVLNYKPSADRESLFLQSRSRVLIETIFEEVEARNSGTQGTN